VFCIGEEVEDLGVAPGAAAELEIDHGDGSLTAVVLGGFEDVEEQHKATSDVNGKRL
jgi:hypothetical protein